MPLDTLGNWEELAAAGLTNYEPKPSKQSYNYGLWRGFPDRYKYQVRDYGYAVYHDAGAINNFAARFEGNNEFLIRDLKQETSSEFKKQRQHAYGLIEQYLTIQQAYTALVRGIKVWTGIKDANELNNVSNGFTKLNQEVEKYNDLIYSEVAGISKLFDPGDDKKQALRLIDNFTPIDTNKSRIAHSTNKALSDYLNKMFAPGTPQNATMLINAIATGLKEGDGNHD